MSESESKSSEITANSTDIKRKSSRRKWFIALSLLFGIFIATLGGELALRVYVGLRGWTPNCYATGQAFFVPDQNAGRTLRPNLRLRSSTYNVSVNRLGLRGPEVSQEKPSGIKRIAVLGGSSVFGYLVGEGLDSCRTLEEQLVADGERVEVLNAGVPGYNLTQCRYRFESLVADLEPDIVIVYAGWNESPFLIRNQPEELERCPAAPSLAQRILARSTLYGFLRYRLFPPDDPEFAAPADAETHVTEAGANLFHDELNRLLAVLTETDAQVFLCSQVSASEAQTEDPDFAKLAVYLGGDAERIRINQQIGRWINEQLREAANRNGLNLIDCAANIPATPQTLGDAIHLTEEGHRRVAEEWYQALQSRD